MDKAVEELRSRGIKVLIPGDEDYNKAIATSNLVFRFSRPECVVRPTNAAQVQIVIKEAKARKINVTIKGNGHSYAGHSTAFKGISLDLRDMKTPKLDMTPGAETVTFDAGCQWGKVYETLINDGHDGYVVIGGRCPTVGVSGFLLGGGLSPFTRGFGMGSDNLLEATVVTADGDLVTVKASDDPKSNEGRLFWALCGAGGGNFGVVVNMKMKVQQLKSRGDVVAGRYQWFPEKGFTDDVMDFMNDFYVTDWPNELTIDSTWICDLRQKNHGGVRFTITYDGNKQDYDALINKHIKREDLNTQLKRRVLAEPSTRYLYETLVNQWLEETERAYPANKSYELYSSFVFSNKDRDVIENVTGIIREATKIFRALFHDEQVNLMVTWIHSGGKATESKPTDSAFFWREAVFHVYITVEWLDKWMEDDMRRFLSSFKAQLRPLSFNNFAAYINFPDKYIAPTPGLHEYMYFGDNVEELRNIKKIWDKDNFFDWDQGISLPKESARSGAARAMLVSSHAIRPSAQDSVDVVEYDEAEEAVETEWKAVTETEGIYPRKQSIGGPVEIGSWLTANFAEVGSEETDRLASSQWSFFRKGLNS